jgi:hypothetical protein
LVGKNRENSRDDNGVERKVGFAPPNSIPDQLDVKELARLGERGVRRVAADQLRAIGAGAVVASALAIL